MRIEPYLFFEGRCEEALEFYKKALGAKVESLMRMKESPEAPPPGMPPGSGEKVMHASFTVGESRLMASDGMAKGNPKFEGFSFAITAATERRRTAGSTRSPRAARCACRCRRPSSRRASGWSRTSSAWAGW